jgi:exosortase A-associated hydrolase 2
MLQPLFIDAPDGSKRFALHHTPAEGRLRGLVVYVQPFAEEMNKSRRMAALQSRALAAAGYAVLQIDLAGCGDSQGEWASTTWADWVADVMLATHWLRQQHGQPGPLWLWGLRSGCLLACAAARQLDEAANVLFWQAPASGKPLLQQFLRLKMAADLQGGNAAGTTAALRAELAQGQAVDLAGYRLSSALALGLEAAELSPPRHAGQCVWLETSTRVPAALLPASGGAMQRWTEAGWHVAAQAVTGPAFWQTQEIEDAPALLSATLQALKPAAASAATP